MIAVTSHTEDRYFSTFEATSVRLGFTANTYISQLTFQEAFIADHGKGGAAKFEGVLI